MKYRNGLVIGKFMPPHKGHEYLIRFAKQYCEKLTVVVDCLEEQTLPPELRRDWLKEQISDEGIRIVALTKFMPQDPKETSDFWDIWRNELLSVAGQPDVLVAAMDYGWKLSEVLGCEFVPGDISRESIPVSATEIRTNIFDNWGYLIESARPFFMKKVCFVGPESTGKTTLAKKIAKDFKTIYVPEYAKLIIDSQGGQINFGNIEQIAIAQNRSEKALGKMVNKVMVCDTDCITTMVWSKVLFGKVPKELEVIASNQKYDLTFLMYPDTAWVNDTHREVIKDAADEEFRYKMFEELKETLEFYNRRYVIINGGYQERENRVSGLVRNLIGQYG